MIPYFYKIDECKRSLERYKLLTFESHETGLLIAPFSLFASSNSFSNYQKNTSRKQKNSVLG
jgi:hypothetical protein